MRGPSRKLPARLHLPSGLVVRLDDRAARSAAEASSAKRGPLMRARAVLSAEGVLKADDGAPAAFDDLALSDAHVLRALLLHAGVLAEEPASFSCESCGADFSIAPSTALEIGPFVDGELDDPELDRSFDFQPSHPVAPLRVGGRMARSVRLAPRTVGEALALWRSVDAPTLQVTPALVSAMGIVAIGAERRAKAIADALARAPDRAFDDLVDVFHEAHYPPRLMAVHRCAACGARNDLDVPLDRELPRGDRGARPLEGTDFPDLDAFEALVRSIADEVYAERGVRNIGLFIDAGPPDCDDGGEPLLGSYVEGSLEGAMGIAEPPEIKLYFQTFRAAHEQGDAPDVAAEIRETIDHEVTHHLHHLQGDDPLDDEERDEIEREEARRVGRSELSRRARRGFSSDLAGFFRVAWPVLLLVAAAFAIAWCGDGRGP